MRLHSRSINAALNTCKCANPLPWGFPEIATRSGSMHHNNPQILTSVKCDELSSTFLPPCKLTRQSAQADREGVNKTRDLAVQHGRHWGWHFCWIYFQRWRDLDRRTSKTTKCPKYLCSEWTSAQHALFLRNKQRSWGVGWTTAQSGGESPTTMQQAEWVGDSPPLRVLVQPHDCIVCSYFMQLVVLFLRIGRGGFTVTKIQCSSNSVAFCVHSGSFPYLKFSTTHGVDQGN